MNDQWLLKRKWKYHVRLIGVENLPFKTEERYTYDEMSIWDFITSLNRWNKHDSGRWQYWTEEF